MCIFLSNVIENYLSHFFDALIRVGEGILFCGGDWNTILNVSLDMTSCKKQKT